MRFILLVSLLLAGCAMQPMTPEEVQANQEMSRGLQQGAQAFQRTSPQVCTMVDVGGGVYQQTCH